MDESRSEIALRGRALLTSDAFQRLRECPPEVEWLGNFTNENTREAYRRDIAEFVAFLGIQSSDDWKLVTRPHVIAWRDSMAGNSPATIRRKMSALASLFNYLCERNSIQTNPVPGVKRPRDTCSHGKTPALSDSQAHRLLEAPSAETLLGKRDRALLATFLFLALRCSELSQLKAGDLVQDRGIDHLRVFGKGSKVRVLPMPPKPLRLIREYLDASGHGTNPEAPLFRATRGRCAHLSRDTIYYIVTGHAEAAGVKFKGLCVHSLRATAATCALENGADLAKVQEWLGHVNIHTTRLYDRRQTKPEESPGFAVSY
ncbi:integrase [Opitutaceae bacterium EW11]|nr:integrase [Opitutaceae bacterium EW11]